MLVLASASPRRAALLRSAGREFTVAPVDADEAEFPGEPPIAYVARIARAKAELALPAHPGAVILAADTTVWIDPAGPPLGKPSDRAAAERMLLALTTAGTHHTTTAFVLADARGSRVVWHERHVTTEVRMRSLPAAELAAYLDGEDWRDKAGGYAIQGRAAAFVRALHGSYSNVVGLPLYETAALLDGAGYKQESRTAASGSGEGTA